MKVCAQSYYNLLCHVELISLRGLPAFFLKETEGEWLGGKGKWPGGGLGRVEGGENAIWMQNMRE